VEEYPKWKTGKVYPSTGGYLARQEAVLQALKVAYHEKGEKPVTISEVRSVGQQFPDSRVPSTKMEVSEEYIPYRWHTGGNLPFDFPDRTQRWLNRLVKRGLATRETIQRGGTLRHYYKPVEKVTAQELGAIQIERLTEPPAAGPYGEIFDRVIEAHPEMKEVLEQIAKEARSEEELKSLLKREGLLEE
jgi:hypothetical protein